MKSFFKKLLQSKKGIPENSNSEGNAASEEYISILKSKGRVDIRASVPSKNGFVLSVQVDKFNGDLSIKFIEAANYRNGKIMLNADGGFCPLDLDFRFEKDKHLLVISTYQKLIRIKPEDKVSFLFEGGRIVAFVVSEKGYKIGKDEEGVLIESRIPVSENQIREFEKEAVIKWRYTPADGVRHFTGTLNEEKQQDLYELASSYLSVSEQFITDVD